MLASTLTVHGVVCDCVFRAVWVLRVCVWSDVIVSRDRNQTFVLLYLG